MMKMLETSPAMLIDVSYCSIVYCANVTSNEYMDNTSAKLTNVAKMNSFVHSFSVCNGFSLDSSQKILKFRLITKTVTFKRPVPLTTPISR